MTTCPVRRVCLMSLAAISLFLSSSSPAAAAMPARSQSHFSQPCRVPTARRRRANCRDHLSVATFFCQPYFVVIERGLQWRLARSQPHGEPSGFVIFGHGF